MEDEVREVSDYTVQSFAATEQKIYQIEDEAKEVAEYTVQSAADIEEKVKALSETVGDKIGALVEEKVKALSEKLGDKIGDLVEEKAKALSEKLEDKIGALVKQIRTISENIKITESRAADFHGGIAGMRRELSDIVSTQKEFSEWRESKDQRRMKVE